MDATKSNETSGDIATPGTPAHAWLQLACAKLSPRKITKLLDAFACPLQIMDACQEGYPALGKLKKQLQVSEPVVEKALEWAQAGNNHLLIRTSTLYPPLLTEIADPPPVLFVKGSQEVLSKHQLAIVGSRKATHPALQITRRWAHQLSGDDLLITSGLAYGVDAEAHRGCLQAAGKSIAVIATGPDICYPARHQSLAETIAESGAVVTEFPPGVAPLPRHFPQRNRLISGLSLATLVVEAGSRSGTLVTARHALEQNRDVFCMPGSVLNPLAAGCHQLIRDGAQLVSAPEHITSELGLQPVTTTGNCPDDALSRNAPDKSTTATQSSPADSVLQPIGFDPFTPDSLCEILGSDIQATMLKLQELELNGAVISLGDGRYQRCR